MEFQQITVLASAALVASVGVLLVVSARPGPAAWIAGLHLLLLGLASAAHAVAEEIPGWTARSGAAAATSLFLLAALVALVYVSRLREQERARWARRLALVIATLAYGVILVAFRPVNETSSAASLWLSKRQGLLTGSFLLVVSLGVLAQLEQAFRAAPEHERWELKWLLLGLAAPSATAIFSASQILLGAARSDRSLQVIGLVAVPGALLSLVSWWRCKRGASRIRVSQDLAHSTLTLLLVGGYLSIASAVSGWIGSRFPAELDANVVVFAVATLGIGAFLVSGRVHARSRDWVRRNVFRGTYDYRAYWIAASESIRSEEPPERSAIALARLVQSALDAQEVSVWLRDESELSLACRMVDDRIETSERIALPEPLLGVVEPITRRRPDSPTEIDAFFEATRAQQLAPLLCVDDWLGVLCVGASRSGRPHAPDSIEFLRVLAGYAARALHSNALLELRAKAREQEAFRSFSLFLLHDLKNFATTLSMVATNAARHSDKPEFRQDAFHSVLDTAERMKRLCNSLRSFSDSPRVVVACSLDELARELVAELPADLVGRISLELAQVHAQRIDREGMRSVLRNLLLNAQDATGPQGRIKVSLRSMDDEAELVVRDDGCGMPAEFLRRELFTPFRTTKVDGLGVGLYHARRVLEAHGGSIRVESEAGVGTVVTCRLPRGAGSGEA